MGAEKRWSKPLAATLGKPAGQSLRSRDYLPVKFSTGFDVASVLPSPSCP